MTTKKRSPVRKRNAAKDSGESLNFATLVKMIQRVHEDSALAVNRVINTTVTLRNWIIGAYIVEYEMRGADRAKYGERLLERLAERLTGNHVPSCEVRRLYGYRHFFRSYPQIVGALSPLFPGASRILRSVTAIFGNKQKVDGVPILRSVTAELAMSAEKLLGALSSTRAFRGWSPLLALRRSSVGLQRTGGSSGAVGTGKSGLAGRCSVSAYLKFKW